MHPTQPFVYEAVAEQQGRLRESVPHASAGRGAVMTGRPPRVPRATGGSVETSWVRSDV
jgi:hypothetical protein